jgi:hypothetical protein
MEKVEEALHHCKVGTSICSMGKAKLMDTLTCEINLHLLQDNQLLHFEV